MRRLVYSAACSLDGYIARHDHSVDWIPMDPDVNFAALLDRYDTVLLGRRTHDFMMRAGTPSVMDLKTCVWTRDPSPPRIEGVLWIKTDPVAFVRQLKKEDGKDLWLMGGSDFARALLEADLVDELEFTYVPVVLGDGISLFPKLDRMRKWKLVGELRYKSSGMIQLRYERP